VVCIQTPSECGKTLYIHIKLWRFNHHFFLIILVYPAIFVITLWKYSRPQGSALKVFQVFLKGFGKKKKELVICNPVEKTGTQKRKKALFGGYKSSLKC